MPQVPTSFVPQVSDSGATGSVQFVAPGIAPAENLAAQQQMELGRATQNFGERVWRIGQIIEDDINTAKAKRQEGVALDAIEGILNGQGGYMYAQGQDAEARFGATESEIAKSVQGAMDGLDNDVQKAMFQQSISRAMTNARSRMVGHRNDQLVKWQAAEADARAKRFVGQAIGAYDTRNDARVDANGNPVGQYATNVRVALEEARKAGRMLGYPEDSEAMRGMERGVMDAVAAGVVGRLMDREDYNGALEYLGSVKGQIGAATHEKLLSGAYSAQRRAGIEEISDNIMNYGRVDSVALTRPYVTPVPGATMERIDTFEDSKGEMAEETLVVSAPEGSPIHAPYDGKIVAIAEARDGISLKIQLDDGRVAYMRGISPGSTEVGELYAGKAISRNEIIGTVGKRTVPVGLGMTLRGQGSFMYSLEENGKPISVRDVNSVSSESASAEPTPPESLDDALRLASLVRKDVADVREVRQRIRQKWAERAEQQAASYQNLLLQVDRYDDPFDVPEGLWTQLKPADQKVRMESWREANDINVVTEYAISPGSFDLERVQSLRGSLTEQTYRRMLDAAASGANKVAQVDAQALQAALINNGLDSLAFPDSDANKAARTLLFQRIEEDLASERKRGDVTPERRQEIIDFRLMHFGQREHSVWSWTNEGVHPKPLAAMTPEELRKLNDASGATPEEMMGRQFMMAHGVAVPIDRYNAIVAAIRNEGGRVTPARVRAMYESELNRD